MDFHSLSRKELQAICKKNKIPANITNVAMADALQSLEHVEGLDELLNSMESCGQHSPEKTANGLVDFPCTAARTSTRRAVKEPPSSQAVTQTRRTTRRMAQQVSGQENTVLNTPAVPTTRRRAAAGSAIRKMDTQMMDGEDDVGCKKGDMAKTPAISTKGRKAPAASARSKKVDTSVQKVYSTRRSVKLLEVNMCQLTLEAKGEAEPLKMESEDEAKTDADLTLKNSDNENTLSGSAKNDLVNEEEYDDSANSDGKTDAIIDDKTTVGKGIEFSNEPEKTNEMPPVEYQPQITAPEQDIYSENPEKELKDVVNEEGSDCSAHSDGNTKAIVNDQTIKSDMEFSDEAEKTDEMLQVGNQTETIAPKDDVDSDIPAADEEETVQKIGEVFEIHDQSIKMEDLVDAEVIEAADFAKSSILSIKSLNPVTGTENPESKTQDFADSEILVDVNVIPEVEYSIPTSNLPSPDQDPAAPTKEVNSHSPIASLPYLASKQTLAKMSSRTSAMKDQVAVGEMPPVVTDNKENIQIISNTDDENMAKKDMKSMDASRTSAMKDQVAVGEMPPVVTDNKENIQIISNTDDENMAKKDMKSMDASTLEDLSIRQLTKLLKEKLQITNNEPKNIKENAGNPRQALQAVPDNVMKGNENKLK